MYECCPCFCTNSRSSRHFCYITRLRFRTFNISQHISQSLLPLNKAKKTSKTGKPASGHKLLKVIWALKLQEQRGPAGAAPVSSWQALEWLSVKSRRALNFHQQPSHWEKVWEMLSLWRRSININNIWTPPLTHTLRVHNQGISCWGVLLDNQTHHTDINLVQHQNLSWLFLGMAFWLVVNSELWIAASTLKICQAD